jgi:hypothetical protein
MRKLILWRLKTPYNMKYLYSDYIPDFQQLLIPMRRKYMILAVALLTVWKGITLYRLYVTVKILQQITLHAEMPVCCQS